MGESRLSLVNIGDIQYIQRMASDLLSLADASALLGVSSERVRQLVVAGDLPGVRFGNAWAVPRDAVDARRQVSNRRGRPLSAMRAWEAVAGGDVDLSNVSRYRNRGDVYRYSMSSADQQFLSQDPRVLVSGVSAAAGYGEGVQVSSGEGHFYMAHDFHTDLHALVAAVPDPLGSVIVRVIPDDLWSQVYDLGESGSGSRLAPSAAVALDLMESGDPRHWVAAENLIGARD